VVRVLHRARARSYSPPCGPISGDTNVTVSGAFAAGMRYDCYFGQQRSPAFAVVANDSAAAYSLTCMAPASLAPGRVVFSLQEDMSARDVKRAAQSPLLDLPVAAAPRSRSSAVRVDVLAIPSQRRKRQPSPSTFYDYYVKPTVTSITPREGIAGAR
jgi:hypothetical protein